ncbi:ABC transporter permease [Franconibacter daqui]|nr:iron chelate uptake ABC transporter family permease subunit [Franconibacter daqui]GGD06929.1 ABC transporter permease [Franconibacter daqui]
MTMAAVSHQTRKTAQRLGLFLASAALLGLVIAFGVGVGELSIPLKTTLLAITNRLGLTAIPLNRIHETVIWDFRLSRALVAACSGAGLAICGAVLQSLLKNALAEPYVLGVSAGASTGAVSVVVLGVGAGAVSLSAGAFTGAFLAFLFVAVLTNGARGGNERTILAGVAASQLFNAITAYTISTSASAQQARDVMFWLLGSFSGVRWPEFQLVLVVVLLGLAVCLYYAKALDAFIFGDDAAASLGIPVGYVRLMLFAVTALMTATIVSMAGSIGFVGLVVPHVMRYFFGPLHRTLLVACAMMGAIFMVLADIVSRTAIAPQSLPVGVVTALVGVPFFAVILYRSRTAA